MRKPAYLAAAALLLLACGRSAAGHLQTPPRIAAAADLKFALDEIARAFERDDQVKLDLIYGSSGTLARQMLDGAPFDLFLSADESYIEQVAQAGLTKDRGVLYATGRLVIFASAGSPLPVDPELKGLKSLADSGRLTKFAIANPAHAPYGRAAEAVLRKRGLWARVQPSLVLGENIAQAAQFTTMGGVSGGLLAYSLVLAPPMRDRGTYALIPAEDHPPLRQRMVLLKRAGAGAEAFYAYLQQPSTRAILRRYGFSVTD